MKVGSMFVVLSIIFEIVNCSNFLSISLSSSSKMQDICSKLNLKNVEIMDKVLSEQDRIVWESMGLTPDVQSMESAALLTKVFRSIFVLLMG